MRIDGRNNSQLREVTITRNYTKYAEGSVFIEFGETKVLCTATVDEHIPQFLKDTKTGWVTAEYAMLPRATHTRSKRDSMAGKVNSRAQEISRLIGRSLRNAVDLKALGERQIIIDCDVIQADGGTRTASITGAFVALYDAINNLLKLGKLAHNPLKYFIAAISLGVHNSNLLLDLNYIEDRDCEIDLNLVMTESLDIIEIQGTAEGIPLKRDMLNQLIDLGQSGIIELINKQKIAVNLI